MQLTSKRFFYPLLAFLLALLVLFFFYHEVLLHPNSYVFAPNGDGIKNYYAYIFHARYDSDFWHFGGMNYPFYEHMVYTDGHPLLSWLAGFFGLSAYGIGILNFLMLISFPVCAVFLYKILDHYGVKKSWALFAALAITFMSPQLYRLTGHLSLSYVFAIPALWWLIILSLKYNRWKWSLVTGIYILAFFFTHPYLGMILAFFSLFFWMVRTAWYRSEWRQNMGALALQVVLPILVFQLLVQLTDTHENRLGQPGGFFNYYASWKSVFVPHDGPLSHLTHKWKIDVGNWESWNYVGFSTIVFAWIILIYLVRKRREIAFRKIIRSELALFTFAAYLILLFAFCFPLKYEGLKKIVDMVGPLQQFRVLGRFGWIFFYVFTVFSVVGVYKIYARQLNKMPLRIVFICGVLFYAAEFYPMHKGVSAAVSTAKNPFEEKNLPPPMQELVSFVNTDTCDAILFLPFQHMSSENIMMLGSEQANYDAFVLSYHTQKPLMNAVTSRMSYTEAVLFNNFFSPEFVEKELVRYLPENARILIVKNKDLADPDELRLIYSSEKVYENELFKVFRFDRDRWNTRFYFDLVKEEEKLAKTGVGEKWTASSDSVFYRFESFDDRPGESFDGNGALHGYKGGADIIATWGTNGWPSGTYSITFWYHLLTDRPDILAVAEQDSIGDKRAFWYDTQEISQSTFIVDDWCFVRLDIEISPDIEKVNLIFNGNGNGKPFIVDELMIRKTGKPCLFRRVMRGEQEYIVYDNYWLKADSFQ
jgi:hypothetical protein